MYNMIGLLIKYGYPPR